MNTRILVRGLLATAGWFVLSLLFGLVLLPGEARGAKLWSYLAILSVIFGFGAAWYAENLRRGYRKRLDRVMSAMVAGNLAAGVDQEQSGLQADFPVLPRLLRTFRNLIAYLQGTSHNVSEVSVTLAKKTRQLSADANEQVSSVEKANASIKQLDREIGTVVEQMDSLSGFTEQTSSSILQMRSSIQEVVEASQHLAEFVDEIAASMTEMARSIEEVASHSDGLSSFAIENASAMVEMDATTSQIAENIKETEALSGQVARVAQEGGNTVKDTVGGLEKIQEAVEGTVKAIESLGSRSQEIGKILKVIRDIADQTNLLSLNAAIIAAQAGEHGKGFAVVAEEIRELAERTAASTAEVSEIVNAIQKEATAAVRVTREGMERVQEGMALGKASEESLQRIREAIGLAATSISHIVRAAAEQSKSSRQVTEAIEEMTKRVERISVATREQANTSQMILKKTMTMKELTQAVQQAATDESAGSDTISRGMERVRSSVETSHQALLGMSKASQRMVEAVQVISGASMQTHGSARDLASAASLLRQESLLLAERLGGFVLPAPNRGGQLTIGLVAYNYNLDPAFANNVRDGQLCHAWGEGLLKFGDDTRLLAGLAESWEVNSEGTLYTFHLRKNAVFHNNRPVTAQDVLFSWHRSLSPRLTGSSQWFLSAAEGALEYMEGSAQKITGLKAPDDRTVSVKLKEPVAFFLYMLTTPEAFILPREAVDEQTLQITQYIGCGVYKVAETSREKVTLTRFNGYYDQSVGFADRVIFDYGSASEGEVLEGLREGRLHVALSLSNEALEDLLQDPAWESNTESTVLLNTQIVAVRNDMAPGNIKEFRQALNYAVDRQGLLSGYAHSRVTPARGILPPGMLGYRSDRQGYAYDPDKARWLLGRAGFQGGLDLAIQVDTSRQSQYQEFQKLVTMFGDVGVRIKLEPLSHEAFEARRRQSGRPLLYSTGWYADFPDPDNFFYVLFHRKGGDALDLRYSNPQLDEIIEKARRSLDMDERTELYHQAEDIVVEEAPCVFLYHNWGRVPFRPEVMGMKLSLTPPLLRPEHVWLAGAGKEGKG